MQVQGASCCHHINDEWRRYSPPPKVQATMYTAYFISLQYRRKWWARLYMQCKVTFFVAMKSTTNSLIEATSSSSYPLSWHRHYWSHDVCMCMVQYTQLLNLMSVLSKINNNDDYYYSKWWSWKLFLICLSPSIRVPSSSCTHAHKCTTYQEG